MARGRNWTDAQREVVVNAYADPEISVTTVAKLAGVSNTSVYEFLRKAGVPTSRNTRTPRQRSERLRAEAHRKFQAAWNLSEEARKLIEQADTLDRLAANHAEKTP